MLIELVGWMIPALITLIAAGFVAYIAKDDWGYGMFGGIATIMTVGMVSPFVALAWAVYAFVK